MSSLNLNEFAALSFVLKNICIKDLLHYAMNGFANVDTPKTQDNANICSQAIDTFLS